MLQTPRLWIHAVLSSTYLESCTVFAKTIKWQTTYEIPDLGITFIRSQVARSLSTIKPSVIMPCCFTVMPIFFLGLFSTFGYFFYSFQFLLIIFLFCFWIFCWFFDSCSINATRSYENVMNIGSYIKILEQNSNKYMNVKTKSRSVLPLVRQTIVPYAIVKHQHKITE